MGTTAFPVRQAEDGTGCTDVTMRRILGALYPDKGVVSGLKVFGTTGLAYKVDEGVAVCSKDTDDGNTLAYFEGGTVAASANASSNPRIDVVWLESHDLTQGDADNLVALGVTEGTPAATPVEPDAPTYATKLAVMFVPAQASTTSSATRQGDVDQAVPYGASLGLVGELVVTYNANWDLDNPTNKEVGIGSTTFSLPTRRLVQFNVTVTMGANGGTMADGDGSVYSVLYLDGAKLERREIRLRATGNAVSQFYQYTAEVPAGPHTLQWKCAKNAASSLRFYYQKGDWAGQQVQMVDLGPVG